MGLWARSGDEDKMLRLAGAVEKLSEHPLAKPVVAARKVGLLPEATSFRVLTGRGVVAEVEGRQVAVGTPRLMAELGITVDEEATERLQKRKLAAVPLCWWPKSRDYRRCLFGRYAAAGGLPVGRAAQEERHSKRSHAHR